MRMRCLYSMKKQIFAAAFFITALSVSAQRLPTVGILPFETSGSGVSADDAAQAVRMVASELNSWGNLTVLQDGEASGAEYLVRGEISRQNNQIVLSAATSEARTGKSLNSSKEQAPSLSEINIESFCEQITQNVPFPNFLLGTWRSTIDTSDGPVTCILEFR